HRLARPRAVPARAAGLGLDEAAARGRVPGRDRAARRRGRRRRQPRDRSGGAMTTRRIIWAVRYLLPAVIVLVGIAFLIANPGENWEGAAGLIGAGLSVL